MTFGKLAEVIATHLKKGRQVYVEGRLTVNEFTTKQGEKRSKVEITAQQVQFLGPSPQQQLNGHQGQASLEAHEEDF